MFSLRPFQLFSLTKGGYPNRCIRLSLLAKQIKTTELSGKTSEVKVTGKTIIFWEINAFKKNFLVLPAPLPTN